MVIRRIPSPTFLPHKRLPNIGSLLSLVILLWMPSQPEPGHVAVFCIFNLFKVSTVCIHSINGLNWMLSSALAKKLHYNLWSQGLSVLKVTALKVRSCTINHLYGSTIDLFSCNSLLTCSSASSQKYCIVSPVLFLNFFQKFGL